jgi:hypothetical protein
VTSGTAQLSSAAALPGQPAADGGDERGGLEGGPPFAHHVAQRAIVLPHLRILFLPTPKGAATTMLWLLADLAGIARETFAPSDISEPSSALTIHDMTLWPEQYRLAQYDEAERERMLAEDGWFRFSIVRHPAPRLWSAWQSKLLLREPRFFETFGEEPWFPRVPERPADVVTDFRRFVAAVAAGEAEDVHWAVQADLVSQLPLTHVGRLESIDRTLAELRAHASDAPWPADLRRENRTLLAMPPGLYDTSTAQLLHGRYAADFETFGYEPVAVETDADNGEWEARTEALLPAIHEVIDKHARMAQLIPLAQQARRVETLEKRIEAIATRQVGHSSAPVLTNLESLTDFNVRWTWAEEELEDGFTAVVRVKNEARSLPRVLPPLLRAVRRVVVVDNGSTDGTPEVALRVAEEEGARENLEVLSYPFSVARCGQEHLETPGDSVHSLAYFYNWSFSHVRTRYSLKWDGDMVLTDAAVQALRDLSWQLEAIEAVVKIPRYPFYIADERHGFVDLGLRNNEPWGWPNLPGYSFVKALDWELPLWPRDYTVLSLPSYSCVELKHLDADEFAHWSPTDFEASSRTQRKRREWEVFNVLASGGECPSGVIPVEAPEGEHVIDYVRTTWLPERAKQPPRLGQRLLRELVEAP